MSFDNVFAWTDNERRMLKYMLEHDGIQFMRYFFKAREGDRMIRNWHHYVIEYVLQAVFDLLVTRLIINIAPGYSKTEQAVVNFIARGLARNARSKFIHASYSSDLAQQNSQKIKDTVQLPEFQELWPMQARTDSKSKKRWYTEQGGGMMTASTHGQITGFRAGRMETGFSGAFILDDPVKPDDAHHLKKRKAVNDNFTNTMRSRLALETVPMIVIMQRIHDDDLTGHLLRGGSGDTWHHLAIPALLTDELLTKPYNDDYTHGIRILPQDILTAMHTGRSYDFQLW